MIPGQCWGGGRGVSPAWNSCACPCGVLTGSPARPAGRTGAPCKENKETELEKEQEEKERQASDRYPAVQAATAAMWRQLWFSQQAQRARGQRAEGRAASPTWEPGPTRWASRSHIWRTTCPPLGNMRSISVNSQTTAQAGSALIKPILEMGKLTLKDCSRSHRGKRQNPGRE